MKYHICFRLQRLAACLMIALLMSGCKEQLYTGVSEREANDMVAVLQMQGISAGKAPAEEGMFKVEVSRDDFARAINVLRDRGLPQARFSSIGDVFKRDGLVATANAERLRFMYAMSEELSRTLSQIDGVMVARVHPVLPGGDPLTDKVTPASASVFIKHVPDADLSVLAPAIKDMVSASIEGLKQDKISVIFVPAQQLPLQDRSTSQRVERSVWFWAVVALAITLMVAGGVWLIHALRFTEGNVSNHAPLTTSTLNAKRSRMKERWLTMIRRLRVAEKRN
jgi:type III secretion protein J